jgi:replication factor A1
VHTGGRLKVAQKQYSSIRNDYEITFDTQSDIRPVEDDHKIQIAQYNFRKVRYGAPTHKR